MRDLALLLLLAGCYAPQASEGAPCVTSEQCPAPQRCSRGACTLADQDPPPDATPVDAADTLDAPPLPCTTAGLACPGGAPVAFGCGARCWAFCNVNTTHGDARAACGAWQGALGQIDDKPEQECVAPRVTANAWIALAQLPNQAAVGTGWTWHGTVPLGYASWQAGAPNDADGIENGAEQCGHIQPDGSWDDESCASLRMFFCERPGP